jgi:ligand-binding sensor domain-containing protein
MPWDIESILYKFDGKDWSSYSSNNSKFPSQSSVSAIICDVENNLWIGTGSGLVKFDGVEWTTYNSRNSGLLNDGITSILIDEYDNKWIGTLDGLAVFNEGGVILEKEFLNP